ncbi:MAG: DUF58 domain-containing protein [Acidobacteriota bacterium]
MPTQRLLVIAAALTLLVAAGVAAPWLAWAAIAGDAVLFAAFALDWLLARGTPVTAQRGWPPLSVQGSPAEIQVSFYTSARRAVPVIAREALHPAIADRPLRHSFTLNASRGVLWTYPLVPRRRGVHTVGPLTLRISGPLGLARSQRTAIAPAPRAVYPQVRWDGAVGRLLTLAHRHQLGVAPMRYHGAGTEHYALREYRTGDPPNKIHWKATARHGRLVTREETWERGMRLVMLLDAGRAMASMDGSRSKLDHALSATLALMRVAAARGDRVTLVAFSDRIERILRVRAGARGIAHAYEAFFDLEARLAEPAYDLAAETAIESASRGSTVILLTSVVDLAAAELLRESLLRMERKHRAILVNLEDPEVAALAFGPVSTVQQAFAKVASIEILLNNRRLARRLRRSRIRVVSTAADRLAWEAIEAYLNLYRMRRTTAMVAEVRAR